MVIARGGAILNERRRLDALRRGWPESVAEVVDDLTLRFHFPGPDGLAIGKMRGFHITSKEFWGPNGPGFGYKKFGSGDGHW